MINLGGQYRVYFMIKSMTGYGHSEFIDDFGHISVEVKSFNSKIININVKLPEILSPYEHQVINYAKSRIKRGQINISIELDRTGITSNKQVFIDRELAKNYLDQLESLRNELALVDPINLSLLASLPGVLNIEETKGDIEKIWLSTYQSLCVAFDQLIQMRETEGQAMMTDILERISIIQETVERINNRLPAVIREYRKLIQKRLNDLLFDRVIIDESRLAMEIAIMADKCDVSEEIVRIRSHISQLNNILQASNDQVGRQIDFILQEVNREVNTVSAKANDFQISSDCIQIKYEIEKIREQAQNIE